jgi:hypothetical protein
MDLSGPSQEHATDSQPMCLRCKHLIEWPYCLAFLTGEGIPEEIGRGKWDHTLPYPGDHGIRFTAVDSPYLLSEDAFKRLLKDYRGQRVMPLVVDDVQQPTESGPTHPPPLVPDESFQGKAEEGLGLSADSETLPNPEIGHLEPLEESESEPSVLDLLLACARGNRKVVESILDRGVDVNVRDPDHNTALMVACRNCHVEVVRMLIERGADVNATNKYSKTALDIAADWGYPTIINLLREHGGKESDEFGFLR